MRGRARCVLHCGAELKIRFSCFKDRGQDVAAHDDDGDEVTQKIAEEAAQWLVILAEDVTDEIRLKFFQWLKQSPSHAIALLEAASQSATECRHGRLEPCKSTPGAIMVYGSIERSRTRRCLRPNRRCRESCLP